MTAPPIEKRCQGRHTRAFVTADTVDQLATKLVGIIADRRMTKMHRYLGERSGIPTVLAGLRVDRRASNGGVNIRPGQAVSVYLASQSRGLEGVSFGVHRDDETEDGVAAKYHHPEKQWLGERREVTLVELDGWPGQPGRDDSVRIEYWNEHGVGQEIILAFDDLDPIQEIAWDVKGDRQRQVCMWDEFCDTHGLHFEHPDHADSGCEGRQSTRAEDLAVLAVLALREDAAGLASDRESCWGSTELLEQIAAAAYGADCRSNGSGEGRTDAELWASSHYVKDGLSYAERGHYRFVAEAALTAVGPLLDRANEEAAEYCRLYQEAVDAAAAVQPVLDRYQDILHATWLHVPWRQVSKQLATEEKELWADAIEAASHRLEPDDPLQIERWWRDAP